LTGEKNLHWISHHVEGMKQAVETRQLRSFSLMVGGVFTIIVLWPLMHSESPRLWAFVAGGLLLIPGAVWPKGLLPVYRVWMLLGGILGEINSRILLSAIFFGIITPIGMVKRWLGDDPLDRATDGHPLTFRKARVSRPSSHMRRQY